MTAEQLAYNDAKFKELLLYIAEQSFGDPSFGKTKLNKILYYVDFYAYAKFGSPVTGATYVRRPYGPVPREIEEAMRDLVDAGALTIESREHFAFRQDRVIPTQTPDTSIFSSEEKSLIDEVLSGLEGHNAVGVSEMSHRELGWKLATDREEIPYFTVFLSNEPSDADDTRWAREVHELVQSEKVG